MRTSWLNAMALAAVAIAIALVVARNVTGDASTQLLNFSYDPTRELFQDINQQFVARYFQETGKKLTIQQSHGGSSRQARAVIDGAPADVVTLALSSDVDALRKRGLIAADWASRLPNHSQPFTSTIVFVVRKGNPRAIKDWPDLVRPGVSVITPNPKTSGNGKLSVLAAWGSVISRGGTEAQALEYLKQLYQHVPVLDTGARDSTNTFTQEKLGDVHLTWENEALLEAQQYRGEVEIVFHPSAFARSRAWPGLTSMSPAERPRPTSRHTSNFFIPTRGKRPSRSTATGPLIRRYSRNMPTVCPRSISLQSPSSPRIGTKHSRNSLPTMAFSTSFIR